MKIRVNSSNIKTVDWDKNMLDVEFHKGTHYRYFNVPIDVFKSLINAQSVGKYFNSNISKHYNFERVK